MPFLSCIANDIQVSHLLCIPTSYPSCPFVVFFHKLSNANHSILKKELSVCPFNLQFLELEISCGKGKIFSMSVLCQTSVLKLSGNLNCPKLPPWVLRDFLCCLKGNRNCQSGVSKVWSPEKWLICAFMGCPFTE